MISRIRLWMLTNSLWVLRQKCHIWWCFCILANCSRTHSPDMIQIRRAHILDRPYKLRSEHKWTKSNEHRIKQKNEILQIWFHFFISAKSHEKLDAINTLLYIPKTSYFHFYALTIFHFGCVHATKSLNSN